MIAGEDEIKNRTVTIKVMSSENRKDISG